MTGRARAAFRESSAAVRDILGSPGIRRIEAAWACGIAGDAAFLVALLVVAFAAGGPLAVGVVGAARTAPAIVAGTLAGAVAGRLEPGRLLLAVHLGRAVPAIVAAMLAALGGPLAVVVLLAAVSAGAGTLVRPLQASVMPSFARRPDELIAANVAMSTGEGLGAFIGPLAASAGIALAGPAGAFGAAGLLLGASVISLVGLGATADERAEFEAQRLRRGNPDPPLRRLAEVIVAGPAAVRSVPAAATIMIGFGAQLLVRGLGTVLLVVAAIELLGLGEAGVGLLAAATGLGGLAGALGGVGLAGRRRLGPVFAVALVAWGLPYAVLGAWPVPLVAFAGLFVSGVANAVLDVAGFTLLQRTIPTADRVAAFGVIESMAGIFVPLGGLLVPVLIALVGPQGALAVTGAVLPAVAAATWPRTRRADDAALVREEELRLLRGIALFEPLPMTALERIAAALEPARYSAGAEIMREGEEGDRYFIIATGEADVTQRGQHLARCGPGEGVGEIALLRSVPRTATVTAIGDVGGFDLSAAAFRAAIAGPTSAAAAREVAAERLSRSAD
jgi:hypothetical protein